MVLGLGCTMSMLTSWNHGEWYIDDGSRPGVYYVNVLTSWNHGECIDDGSRPGVYYVNANKLESW